jgi:isopentenyldiphosphate isomerase
LRRGLLHRAVATLVVRADGSMLMQQRSRADRWNPGLWTLSSTGHVRKGESYRRAAARELREELGLRPRLRAVGRRLLPEFREGGLREREWVAFFTARSDGAAEIDRSEVEATRDMTPNEAKRMISRGPFTPDARILLRWYFGSAPAEGGRR